MALIQALSREGLGKEKARHLRKEGRLPAVLYGGDRDNRNLSLELKEWRSVLISEGTNLRTQRQNLVIDGKGRAAVLLRDMQVHPLTGNPIHVDFLRFDPNMQIEVNVPVILEGEEECPGVKIGGMVQQVRRELEVSCRAGDIPDEIRLSLVGMEIGDSIHIEDVELPKGVEVHTDVNFTIVAVVGVKAEEVEETEEEEVLEGAEPAAEEGGEA
ncbi:MAG: 50S ribosomal protein L25/general stress protein Ctc [Magnetococcales bacterium]|nr:50S ribosomal protein L25/general stress protein Ctc [Magnetococcales bacterium]